MDFTYFIFPIVTGLSVLTMVGQVIAVILLILLCVEYGGTKSFAFTRFMSRHALVLMLIVALVAMWGSLFFSEIAGWNPCQYCWIQRIFMYPQVILLSIALWKKDRTVATYILALCIIGGLYAAYHYYIQLYDIVASPTNPATPCDASGESCVKTPFIEFGYITIPMMALTAFVLNSLGSILLLRRK